MDISTAKVGDNINTSWQVFKRYSEFRNLNKLLLKKPEYKNKIPQFPGKKFMKKNKEVIEERKKALAVFMNKLVVNINIFEDEDIMKFIKIESNFIKHLRDAWHSDTYSIGIIHSKSSNRDHYEKHPNFSAIMGDVTQKVVKNFRMRGLSSDDGQI